MANYQSTELVSLDHALRLVRSSTSAPADVKAQAQALLAKFETAFTAALGVPVTAPISIFVFENDSPSIADVKAFVTGAAAPYRTPSGDLAPKPPKPHTTTPATTPAAGGSTLTPRTPGAMTSSSSDGFPRWLIYVGAGLASFGAVYFWMRRKTRRRK